MARPTSPQAAPDVAENITTEPATGAYRGEQSAEYGTYRATQPIYVGTALAYAVGDPVPVSNVNAHGYEAAGLVEKVSH